MNPQLSNQFSKLTRDQVKVFKMKTIDRFSAKKISRELNISTNAVWELLHQVRVTLMETL